MRRVTLRRASGLLLLTGTLCLTARTAGAEDREQPFMRGIIISCPGAGRIWGTEEMTTALNEITALGASWIAIHPYAWVPRDGVIRHRPAAETGYLAKAVRRMRAAGVEILWKPHLGYWGSFEWRGSIEFGHDEAGWQRFFATYRNFIVDQARFAEEHAIELFSVGVEYESTMHHEAQWREIIAAVRQVYRGRILYAANWDGLDRVRFWDAVDIIGVHAYFPLSEDAAPSREALAAGWEDHLDRLRQLSQRHGKPIVFAEIGYTRVGSAASRPWEHGSQDSSEHRELRRALMEVALERVEQEPDILGMFWWKWMPGRHAGRDFSLKEEEAREALSRYWGSSAPPVSQVAAD
ncbi:MAG: hypothetical protein O7A98_07135 [Acidobacteria bacterium]|nr:hypothetical protein [Acidobacteriota bacterium]